MRKPVLLIILFYVLFSQCKQDSNKIIRIVGNAQGTTYHISYLHDQRVEVKKGIDSILKIIDLSLSTYVPASIISRINKNDSSVLPDEFFREVFTKAMEISEKTGGSFDVTVGPIINAWGFGFTKKSETDSERIDSLLEFVGYKMVKMEEGKIVKDKPQIVLDFNAIAQGYTVDVLASYLARQGITNYLVELGGEVKAKGKKSNDEPWKVGIDQPNENVTEERPLQAIVHLENKALATSGNYRKFYIENGKKYAHIIDPKTGYPAKHNLLSATVIADDCMTADAYATAFMVMGLEKSKRFVSENKEPGLEVFLIYDSNGVWETYASETLRKQIEPVP